MTDDQSILSRKKFYWPFSVDKILHAHKHLNIDEQIFWFICDRTVWHRRFVRSRRKTTGDWWTFCSGRIVAEALGISQQYARKRLKFLREIGLLKASRFTNQRQYTTVFYDEIRSSYLKDRRWTRKPKPDLSGLAPEDIASFDDARIEIANARAYLSQKQKEFEELRRSKIPPAGESAFPNAP